MRTRPIFLFLHVLSYCMKQNKMLWPRRKRKGRSPPVLLHRHQHRPLSLPLNCARPGLGLAVFSHWRRRVQGPMSHCETGLISGLFPSFLFFSSFPGCWLLHTPSCSCRGPACLSASQPASTVSSPSVRTTKRNALFLFFPRAFLPSLSLSSFSPFLQFLSQFARRGELS